MSKLKASRKIRGSVMRLIKAANDPTAVEVTIRRADLELLLALCAGKRIADVESVPNRAKGRE